MKAIPHLLVALLCCLLATSCQSKRPTGHNDASPRSERQYAEQTEDRARDLYKTGQASMEEARAQAAQEASQQWYATAKARERQQHQEEFEKEFKKSQAATP